MRLLHLHVENFGTLQDFDLTPSDGLNVLYQKNGWGKTTLAVFIKAMLYGLPSTSKRSLDDNERKKYTPWQGGAFGGSIEFETEKGRFRAERFFGVKESLDTFSLYDLDTNLPSSVYSSALGEELFGIDADGFERSTYLSQRSLSGSRDNNSISAKLTDLLDDADDVGNYDRAMELLDKSRRFYIMTGNRGAIAESESALLRLQNELEHCLRVEETLLLREEELIKSTAELHRLEQEVQTLRKTMQKAGLARERTALLEQKNRMRTELENLIRRRERINDFFRNAPPSLVELNEGKQLYERIKDAKARLDAIPEEIPEAATLTALRRRYPKGIPEPRTLDRITRDNDELILLSTKHAAWSAERADDPILRKFPNGCPDSVEIEEAYESLRQSEHLQKEIAATNLSIKNEKPRATAKVLSVGLVCIGAILAALSLLPMLDATRPLLLIGGSVLLLSGGILLTVAIARRRRYHRQWSEAQEKNRERTAESRRLIEGIGELLTAYGLPPASDGELPRRLGELSALTSRYWDAARQARRTEEEMQTVIEKMRTLSTRLQTLFSAFFPNLSKKNDYRAEIDEIRREIDRLLNLENAARTRLAERTEMERELHRLQQELLPFLRRFDPAGKMRAGECLHYVSEQLSEFRRLSDEIAEKRASLTAFISEKQLEGEMEEDNTVDYDRLVLSEQDLQSRIAELQRHRTLLKSELDHLSQETDRIPELEAERDRLKLRLDEYHANANTIVNTAKLLEEAKASLSTRYLGGMQASFEKFLSNLVGSAAPESVMDTSFEVRLRQTGQTRPIESFSRGWRDAVELCIRLSLTDALYQTGEKPFLLLDDPFVNLDDERLPAARKLLETLAADYQILYLVCHKDRI